MFKTANKSKVSNTFLNNKALRGLTGFKSLKFLDGHNHVDLFHVKAKISSSYARCPECNKKSHSVHSTYERHLLDLPIHGKRLPLNQSCKKSW